MTVPHPASTTSPARRWIVIAGAVVAAVLACLLLLHFVSSPKVVKAGELAGVLAGDAQLSSVMEAPLAAGEVSERAMTTEGGLSKTQCLSALRTAQALSYTDTGYTALRWSEARDNPEHVQHYVVQAVVSFPDADRAAAFVANAATTWLVCADQVVVTVGADQARLNWRLAGVVGMPPRVSISSTREDLPWTCQRALRAVSNVVVDVAACGEHISDQGRQIGDLVAAAVPH